MNVLLSFLGRGKLLPGQAAGRPQYEKAAYRFQNGREYQTSFFGLALWKHLAETGRRPHRWVILGTPGSIWGALGECLDSNAYEQCLDWIDRLEKQSAANATTDADILARPNALAEGLGLAPKALSLRLIPEGATTHDQARFANVLAEELASEDRVSLDLTHGFRHLPVIAAFTLSALQWLRNVRLEGFYYGALEMAPRDQPKPVIEIPVCAQLAHIAAASATFRLTGSYRELAEQRGPAERPLLDSADFFESLNRLDLAAGPARNALAQLNAETGAQLLSTPVADELKTAFDWVAGNRSPALRMMDKSELYFQRGEYMKCVTLALEAVILHAASRMGCPLQPGKYDETTRKAAWKWVQDNLSNRFIFNDLHALRNAIAHGTAPSYPSVRVAMQKRESLERLLEECLTAARAFVEDK